VQEDIDAALNRLKEKYERETLSHLEAKQKISDLETYLNELGQQLQMAQQEKMRLEHVLSQSGTSIPDHAKADVQQFKFTPPPSLSNFMNGKSSTFDSNGMPPPPPPPPLLNGPPPPPPPGGSLLGSTQVKPVIKKDVPPSSVPLKCFNWTKISETKVGGTIWTELDEAKLYKVIDLGEFDKLFSAYQKNGNGLHHVSWSKDGNVAAASERGRSMNNL
jgi:dishevelled associated activator of morphogenesis